MKHTTLFVLLCLPFFVLAQKTKTITGIVSDDIDPLSEANIIIKNTNKGTTSNLNGYFEIEAKKNDTLLISFIGYETKEVLLANQKNINVVLDENIAMDEVLLIGYGAIKISCMLKCGINVKEIDELASLIKPKLYPNPSPKGLFNLNLVKEYKKVEIQVATMSGRIVKIINHKNISKGIDIDLSRFPKGMYIINIIADENQLEAKKAIIG